MTTEITTIQQLKNELNNYDKTLPVAMVDDDTVYQWISDYFIIYELPKKQATKSKPKQAKKDTPKPVNKVKKQEPTPQKTEKGESDQQIKKRIGTKSIHETFR